MTSWHYFDNQKKQRQAKLAYNLIQNKENTKGTEFIWNESLIFETNHLKVEKLGFKVLYKKSTGFNNQNRIYFFFQK